MEQRLAQFRAARRAPQPTAAPASEQRAGPDAGRGPRDRPAQEETRRPGSPQDVAAGAPAPAPWGARALLSHVALLKFLLWLVLLGLAAELQFGLPCFVLSLFYWLHAGMRGPGERRPGERSAYSVFNPGCQAIQGALTAEQLERELHYGPAAGR
ncbi:SAYSvFN domain-containing protein 1 [Gopherus flavomarginatus]|uniref:SAYSvFN domain-containing protein 1 n=1 Tax=Gopherus flavomarginatus TaxID=286002 RepID=UPI0021CC25E2|nr:SAYSvFN domain-containing protein 1 [Gopherus flavomarginatus]